jgi:hypothetical protein
LFSIDDTTLHLVAHQHIQHCFLDPYAHPMRGQETRRRFTASLRYSNLRGSMAFEMALLLYVTSASCPPIRSRYPHLHSLAC